MQSVTFDARPTKVSLNLDQTALMIIDVQKDFVCKGGYGELLGNDPLILQRIFTPVQKVLRFFRERSYLVIHTREGHLPDLSDCPITKLERWPEGSRIGDRGPMGRILIRGEEGHEIVDEVAPLDGEIIIDKPGKNSFFKTNLEELLIHHGIKNLIISGVTTDVCCFTTTTAANDYGYNAIVLSDCVASYSPERHTAALDIISAQGGIFGWVSNSDQFLREAAKD